MMSDIWEDEFSAYNIDLLKTKATTSDIANEETAVEESKPILDSVPSKQSADNAKELKNSFENPFADSRKPKESLTTDDLHKMAALLTDVIATVGKLRGQVQEMLSPQSRVRLPKGLRIIARNLSDVVHVLIATKTLIDIYIEIGIVQLFQTITESKLQSTTTNTQRMIKAHAPTLQEGLDDISRIMGEDYDRPSANLRARIVKGQTYALLSFAEKQAKSLVDAIDLFPLENGPLLLLSIMAEKKDETIKQAVDNTMRIVDIPQVLVADAPAMLEAVRQNDKKTIGLLQKNMIEARTNP